MHINNCKPLEGKITDPMVLTIKSARKNEQHSEDLKISKKDENLTKRKRFCKKSWKRLNLERTFEILDEEFIANVKRAGK